MFDKSFFCVRGFYTETPRPVSVLYRPTGFVHVRLPHSSNDLQVRFAATRNEWEGYKIKLVDSRPSSHQQRHGTAAGGALMQCAAPRRLTTIAAEAPAIRDIDKNDLSSIVEGLMRV